MKSDGDPVHALVLAHPLVYPAIALHRRRIFGTGEARNFKFGTHLWKSRLVGEYPQRGRGQGPETELLNFKTPSVNL